MNFLVPIQNRLHSVVYYILPHSSCVHLEKNIGAGRSKCIHKMNDHISHYIKNYNLWSNTWSKESVKTNVSFLTLLLIYINRLIFLFLPWISLVSWIAIALSAVLLSKTYYHRFNCLKHSTKYPKVSILLRIWYMSTLTIYLK